MSVANLSDGRHASAEDQGNYEQDKEDDKKQLGNSGSGACNSTKAEDGGDDCNDKKCDGPGNHRIDCFNPESVFLIGTAVWNGRGLIY